MLRKRRTAVRQKLNVVGKPFKGILDWKEMIGRSNEDLQNLLDMGFVMQIAGGTTSQNTVMANPVYTPKAVVVSTDQTINQGDMVWWDPVNFTLKVLTTAAQVAAGATGGFMGVAQGQSSPGVYPDPPAGTPSEKLPGVIVQRGGSVKLSLQANDVVDYPFQAVTAAGVDAQTITKGAASSSNRVGFVCVPLPVSARGAPGATPTPETVAGGSGVEVWIEPKFPATVLL